MFMVIIGKIFKDVGFVLCIVEGDGLKYFRDCVIGRVFKDSSFYSCLICWFSVVYKRFKNFFKKLVI